MKHGKNDRPYHTFSAIEKRIWLNDKEWRQFSPGARDLYQLLKCGFNGHNNGNIQLFYSQVRDVCGLASSRTIRKAFLELETAGWIVATELGGMFRRPNKYRITGKTDKML